MYALVWIWSRYMTINKKQTTQVRILGASTNKKYLEETKKKLENTNSQNFVNYNSQKHTITYEIVEIENMI